MSKVKDDKYPHYFDLTFIQYMQISKHVVSHKYVQLSQLKKTWTESSIIRL